MHVKKCIQEHMFFMPKLCVRRKKQDKRGGSIPGRYLGLIHRLRCRANISDSAASRQNHADCTTVTLTITQ